MNNNKNLLAYQLLITSIFIGLLELFSGYFMATRNTSTHFQIIDFTKLLARKLGLKRKIKISIYEKFKAKNPSERVFLHLPHDPQFSETPNRYLFGFPRNSNIIYCNENDGHIIFKTNSFGFRVTDGGVSDENKYRVLTFGDSYIDGACVNKKDTLASQIESYSNRRTLNLGLGGTGPLYSYALLKEILGSNNINDNIENNSLFIFSIFNGNDINNIRESKVGTLAKYLFDDKKFTGYYDNFRENNSELEKFNLKSILLAKNNKIARNQLPNGRPYGISLSRFDYNNDLQILESIILKSKRLVESKGHNFMLLSIENHPVYDKFIQKEVASSIANLCKKEKINCTRFDLQKRSLNNMAKRGKYYGHLNSKGYKLLASEIINKIKN